MFHAGETEDRASRRPLVKWRTVAQAERVPDAGEVRRREKQAAASRVASCWTSVRSSRGVRSPGPVPAIQAYVAKATTQRFSRVASARAPARLLARRSSPERGSSHPIATNERPMASTRGPRAHEEPLASIERRQVSKARGRWLVLLACCRGVSAAGETPSLLAVQCREPVIADGQPGGGLIVSAQLPSSWEHRPGWTTWSELLGCPPPL